MRLSRSGVTRFVVLFAGVSTLLIAPTGTASASPDQPIISHHDGRCLDVDISSPVRNGTRVQVWDCNGQRNQRWTYFSDRTIRSSYDGRCLDLDVGAPVGNGTRIQVWDCNGWSNQQWFLWTNEPPILSAFQFMCLDEDISSPTHNGTRVQAWQCNTWPNQRWYHS